MAIDSLEPEWECAARAWQNVKYSGGEQALELVG